MMMTATEEVGPSAGTHGAAARPPRRQQAQQHQNYSYEHHMLAQAAAASAQDIRRSGGSNGKSTRRRASARNGTMTKSLSPTPMRDDEIGWGQDSLTTLPSDRNGGTPSQERLRPLGLARASSSSDVFRAEESTNANDNGNMMRGSLPKSSSFSRSRRASTMDIGQQATQQQLFMQSPLQANSTPTGRGKKGKKRQKRKGKEATPAQEQSRNKDALQGGMHACIRGWMDAWMDGQSS